MTNEIGVDSWTPPNQTQIDTLKRIGLTWWAGYVGGSDVYLNRPWPKSGWDLLKANGIKPLPIWVPAQNCSENPTAQAIAAMNIVKAMGMSGVVVLDSEQSMHTHLGYLDWCAQFASVVHAAGWYCVGYNVPLTFYWKVEWGNHEVEPSEAGAVQYGPYTLRAANGSAIGNFDSDSADSLFPFATWSGMVEPTPIPVPIPQPQTGAPQNMSAAFTAFGQLHAVWVTPSSPTPPTNCLEISTYEPPDGWVTVRLFSGADPTDQISWMMDSPTQLGIYVRQLNTTYIIHAYYIEGVGWRTELLPAD